MWALGGREYSGARFGAQRHTCPSAQTLYTTEVVTKRRAPKLTMRPFFIS
jgi:hypothetical protein